MAWTAKLFIEGQWLAGPERLEVRSPGGGAVVTVSEQAGPAELEAAIAAAAGLPGAAARTRPTCGHAG